MTIKQLGTVALLSTLLLGASISEATEVGTQKSDGTIQFKEDTTINLPVDPEDPEKKIEPEGSVIPNPNPTGALSIDLVTNMDFQSQSISLENQTYAAAPIMIKQVAGTTVTRGNYVQVTDKRAKNRTPWTLSAKFTKQFSEGTGAAATALDGSTMSFANPMIMGKTDSANWPTLGAKAKAFTLEAGEDGNQVDVLEAKDVTGAKGFGTYTVEFGQSADYDAGTTKSVGLKDSVGKSIYLNVPGATMKKETTYKGEVTWTLSTTP